MLTVENIVNIHLYHFKSMQEQEQNQKRIQLTPYASARVDEDCSPETIDALTRMAEIAYKTADSKIQKPSVWKDNKHDHFWIEDGFLFESYRTIRGIRYRRRIAVYGMPDIEKCTDAIMDEIAKKYLPE